MAELTEGMKRVDMKNDMNFNGEMQLSTSSTVEETSTNKNNSVIPDSSVYENTGEIILNDSGDPLYIMNKGNNTSEVAEQGQVHVSVPVSGPEHANGPTSTSVSSDIDVKDLEVGSEGEPEEERETVYVKTEKVFEEDLSNKIKFVFNLDGLKEASGLLYIGCKDELRKTNPSKIKEWFTPDFLNLHGVYAIKEEEPFLLRVFTRNHESTNRGIRKKGGRKVMLMGQEVFGDVLLACGHCGYWSHEGSNVRRHLKKSVCLKERGYTKEDLSGLSRIERRKFLRRIAAAKCRAKKKARATADEASADYSRIEGNNVRDAPNNFPSYPTYPECLVEIQENCCGKDANRNVPGIPSGAPGTVLGNRLPQPKVKRKPPKYKALTLGPVTVKEVVQRIPYDIYTINENNERIAWKPPSCHKSSPGDERCQIVFKGARMKRRCMDLPVPMVLIYRKLDCKSHHCNFTLFHANARSAFRNDPSAKASVNVKMYGDIVMTQEFYHYFVSLLSIMKMKSSQTARHLTSVWETIIAERIGTPCIPDEHRKVITLSKQTVKSIWSSIEDEAGNKGGVRLLKGPRKKKKPPPAPPQVSVLPPPPVVNGMNHQAPIAVGTCGVVQVSQPGMQHHCMKRLNHIPPKPPPPPPKPPMMAPPPPPHNHMQQPPHAPVSHAHWLSQGPQYPHNMTPYPMAPPPSAEYYPMPGHFMAQYAPATMGSSP